LSRYVFKMPDLGEGTVEAELVALHVKLGDVVTEDQIMAEVMTEKAAVEVPAPVTGRVVAINANPGDMVAVGSELIVFDTDTQAAAQPREPAAQPLPSAAQPAHAATQAAQGAQSAGTQAPRRETQGASVTAISTGSRAAATSAASVSAHRPANDPIAPLAPDPSLLAATGERIMASPATRRRAREAGIDLRLVKGSGPGGRIVRADLDATMAGGGIGAGTAVSGARGRTRREGVDEVKIIGLRRTIAQRMSAAKREIPHFAYVEEVDVTELETLRRHLNGRRASGTASYTYLPFIVTALTRVLESFPQCNAHFDSERGVVLRHRPVHVGVATQTPDGLLVPVVRNAEALSLRELADEIRRVTEAARTKKATREELSGSTITVTSLGKLGGIVSTPVINAPEVAIIGVNKVVERPVVRDGAIAIRQMMNLSSSFDHRIVDGFDAAAMIQALKERLEHPATIFIEE